MRAFAVAPVAPPKILSKGSRRWKSRFSKRLCRERNLIERFFSKLKHFRHVAHAMTSPPPIFSA
jgi:transposase